MVCSKDSEIIIIIITDDDALKQVPNVWYLGSSLYLQKMGKNKEDIIPRIKEAKITFNNKNQLLCSNNLGLEMKRNL
jgi:hypothetical protein